MTTYTAVYPVAQNDTYVKATTKLSTSFWQYFATDPSKSLTGASNDNSYISANGTQNRFHIDLGSGYVIRRIYYENYNNEGIETQHGVKDFILQGTNEATAFAELTYATDTNWTTIGTYQFDIHASADSTDPKYILVTNTVAYRYYACKFINSQSSTYQAMRRLVLMTEDGYGSFIPRPIFF